MKAKIKMITAMITWGSMGILVKQIDLPSGIIAFVRALIGMAFLFIMNFLIKRSFPKKELFTVKNKWILFACGIALGVNWIFLFEAYKHTTVAVATLSYYIAPILMVIFSTIIFKEKMTVSKITLIIFSLLGLALISGIFDSNMASGNFTGILFGFSAAIAYASFTLLGKQIKGLDSMDSTMIQFGISSLVLLPYIMLNEEIDSFHLYWKTVIMLTVLGIFHTGIAFWLFFSAIRDLKAQTIAVLSFLDPVTAILLSAGILKEKLGIYQIAGACVILGSAFIGGYMEEAGLTVKKKENSYNGQTFKKIRNVHI